jgi:predicted kinase
MNAILESLRTGGTPDFDAIADAFVHHLPMLAELAATPQDPEWHGEGDVHTHTAWVLREVYDGLTPAMELHRRAALILGAAFHDIAKPLTTREAQRGGRTRIIAPRHADRGRSYLAGRCWLSRASASPQQSTTVGGRGLWAEVLALVGHHHDPRQFVVRDEPRGRYWRLARSCDTELLYHLAVADMTGRACPDKPERLEELELFKMACQEYGCFGEDPYDGWRATFDEHAPSWAPDHLQRAMAQGIRDLEAGRIQTAHEAIARGYGLADARGHLYVLCGPSGCGKSSWAQARLGGATVSLDSIRGQLTGDPADQSKNGQVRQEAQRQLRAHLAAGRTVVYDATNLRRDFRRDVVALGWDYGALTTVVAFATPEDVCQKKNAARDRQVPRHIISRQFASWEAPYRHEADTVRWVRQASS